MQQGHDGDRAVHSRAGASAPPLVVAQDFVAEVAALLRRAADDLEGQHRSASLAASHRARADRLEQS